MPKYTREELARIKEDIDAVIETSKIMEEHSPLTPTLFNGKTWKEEKDEWFDIQRNAIKELLTSGKVQSCEIRTLCKMHLEDLEEIESFANRYPFFVVYITTEPVEPLISFRNTLNSAIADNISPEKLVEMDDLLNKMNENCDNVIRASLRPIHNSLNSEETISSPPPAISTNCTRLI